jgi:hypothetical protein
MQSTIIPTEALATAIRNIVDNATGYLDEASTVTLVEGDFDPADPTTWPSASAHFDPIDANTLADVQFDAVSGQWYIVFPDPPLGWDFVASTVTTSVIITGYLVTTGANKVGATKIGPITVTANGQHITLPYVALQWPAPILIAASQPQPI